MLMNFNVISKGCGISITYGNQFFIFFIFEMKNLNLEFHLQLWKEKSLNQFYVGYNSDKFVVLIS